MKTEDILTIEESAENRINLVRDRLFWQAWNRSAFLFVTYIKKYQVHKRFVQKVSQEVAWLGFPKTALAEIEKSVHARGWTFEQKDADHIIIGNISQTAGYEEWWAGIVKKKPKPAEPEFKFAKTGKNGVLAAYKTAYDLCLHVHRATAKMSKEFRYELGARVRGYSMDILESLHLAANEVHVKFEVTECAAKIHKFRVDIRVLKDLQQVSIKQWGFLNNQIELLLDLLRAEFCNTNTRIAGAAHNQSSGTLTTGKPASMENGL